MSPGLGTALSGVNRLSVRGSVDLTQRHLVNRRVRVADGEVATKYVFPFWDLEWHVAFYLLDRFGKPPAVLSGPMRAEDDGRLGTPRTLRDIRDLTSVEPNTFTDLFHFDPWRVFLGIGAVPDPTKRAILPTNIARPFAAEKHRWKVHDVELEPDGGRVRAILAKDEVFRARVFTRATLDLGAFRLRQ